MFRVFVRFHRIGLCVFTHTCSYTHHMLVLNFDLIDVYKYRCLQIRKYMYMSAYPFFLQLYTYRNEF